MFQKDLFNKTILIVDDTPENIDILNQLLSDYNRKLAINGEKALKIAMEDPTPDLILLDIMMPGIDGFEVCRLLRKEEKTKNIPIIFLSAMFDKASIVKGFELGAQDFISKPFDSNELLVRVRTQLQLKHQQEVLKNMNSILEEKVAERTLQLNEANKELLALDEAKNNFLNLISHEIRTPLNGILGSASLLNDMYGEDNDMKEFFELLKVSAERLNKFSITALTITQLQTNNFKVVKQKTDLISLIDDVLNHNKYNYVEKGVTIIKEIAKDKVILDISPQLCTMALNTIISNAIKYTPNNSKVELRIFEEGKHIICEIEDEGNGFDSVTMEAVFKPFGLSDKHKDKKIGIDLAATNMIMSAHGGSITIGNGETNGALVRLSFVNEN